MRTFIYVLLMVVLGNATASKAAALPETGLPFAKSVLTVLCYHNIDLSSPKNSPYSVTSTQFADQLKALKNAGFEYVSVEQVEAFYASGKPLPPRSVLLTFDDGHENIYTRAFPILKSMGIPWLLFVYPTAIGRGHEKDFMDWSEVQTLRKEGVAIGSHSFDHPYLTRPGSEIANPAAYDAWLDKELVHSRKIIEEKLGAKVSAFAYPFGALNETVLRHIRNSGYSLAFNVFGSNNDGMNDPLDLNRIIVLDKDTPETVVKKAKELPLRFGKTVPGSLQVVGGSFRSIEFSLNGLEDFIPDSIHILINGTRIETLKRNGASFIAEIPAPDQSKGYVVTVYAHRKTGEPCSQSYYFMYAREKPVFLQ